MTAMRHREMSEQSRAGRSEIRRPLAALGIVCLLMVGCTAEGGERVAARTPANSPMPTPTPAGLGALAYGVDGDIFVADWDGANAVRIADGHAVGGVDDCSRPEYGGEGSIWSPDGRYLAYWGNGCEVDSHAWGNVIISDPEGNVVASFPGQGWLISWSPDSTRVAVWISWGETIGVYGLDGERQAVLTLPPGLMADGDYDPMWSADGASLMVPNGVEIPLDGSTPRKLPWAEHALQEAFSPDGSRVAYTTHRSLVVAAADGSPSQDVFGTFAAWFVWSPTGDRLAFVSNAFVPNGQLRVLDMATGTVTLLTEAEGSDMLRAIDFSPEGDRILFSRTEDRGRGVSSLWSVDADGSDLRRLVAGTAWGDWLSPSPTH